MDNNGEYHDPDYPGAPPKVVEETQTFSEEEKVNKIKNILRREFNNELAARENEVTLADQRMCTARRMLHRLRYHLVCKYYGQQKLQLSAAQLDDCPDLTNSGITTSLKDTQRNIHPSVRKLLGRNTVDLSEIMKYKGPRNKQRKNYSAMVTRNYTIQADSTKSLRPDIKQEPMVTDSNAPVQKADVAPATLKKIPRQLDPKIQNVVTLDEVTRNKTKHRYRIIIGNTSKYVPAGSRADRSTHKWLLYVRGPAHRPDVACLVTRVCVTLHHSYAPHHTLNLDKPPFHVSRRGWGEFPAKVELYFALPERNRPASIEHTIKLDRNYTGLQTLGAETVVDVWLYSTPEMLEYEFTEDSELPPDEPMDIQPKIEPLDPVPEHPDTDLQEPVIDNKPIDNWLDFFTTDSTELDVDEMIIKPVKTKVKDSLLTPENIKKEVVNEFSDEFTVEDDFDHDLSDPNAGLSEVLNEVPKEKATVSPKKKIMKYMDPTTGKIYYLELDRDLDLSSVQEIVINSKVSPVKTNGYCQRNVKRTPSKKGVSLLKPEVKNEVKKLKCHIQNDHCYLGSEWAKTVNIELKQAVLLGCESAKSVAIVKKEKSLYGSVCESLRRFFCVRAAVNYLLKKVPLMSEEARDPDFLKSFPFVVESEEKYWKLDFAKRRNIEWSRAKLINTILNEHLKTTEQIWRTKQILIYSRLHGYFPFRSQHMATLNDENWSSWHIESESNIKNIYPNPKDLTSLSIFNSEEYNCRRKSDSYCIDLSDSDEEIDVVKEKMLPAPVKREIGENLTSCTVLPVEKDEERLMFLFIERKCADIGIELRNEDIGEGYSYSAVHAVLLSAVKSFAEELLRSALADQLLENTASPPPVWLGSSTSPTPVRLHNVYRACGGGVGPSTGTERGISSGTASGTRLHILTARGRGKNKTQVENI